MPEKLEGDSIADVDGGLPITEPIGGKGALDELACNVNICEVTSRIRASSSGSSGSGLTACSPLPVEVWPKGEATNVCDVRWGRAGGVALISSCANLGGIGRLDDGGGSDGGETNRPIEPRELRLRECIETPLPELLDWPDGLGERCSADVDGPGSEVRSGSLTTCHGLVSGGGGGGGLRGRMGGLGSLRGARMEELEGPGDEDVEGVESPCKR